MKIQKIILFFWFIPALALGANFNPVFNPTPGSLDKPSDYPVVPQLPAMNSEDEKPKLNLEPCPVVTPGQSVNHGPMYGEHLVVPPGQPMDAFNVVPLAPIQEAPINTQLRLADLGYLLPSDFAIAAGAPNTAPMAMKHKKSNTEWNGWKGQTRLPDAALSEAYLASIATGKPGYLMPGGARMQPSGEKFSYSKGNVYQSADPDVNAKVTEDCEFVPQSESALNKLQNPEQSNSISSGSGGQSGGGGLSQVMSALQQALGAIQGQPSGGNQSQNVSQPIPASALDADTVNIVSQALSSGLSVPLLESIFQVITKILTSISQFGSVQTTVIQ